LLVVFLCCQAFACPYGIPIITLSEPAIHVCGVPYTLTFFFASICNSTPTGDINVITPTGIKGFPLTPLPSGLATVVYQVIPTGAYTLFLDYNSGDSANRNWQFGPETESVSSVLAPLVFNDPGLQTDDSDNTTFINIGYQYQVAGSLNLASLHLGFEYTVNVSYSCNQGNGNPHLLTQTIPLKTDSIHSVASANTWFPAADQAWQYSFTLPASICPNKIHIKNIQIIMGFISNQAVNITVQTHVSIPGAQTNNGNGNHGRPVPNINLYTECVNPGTNETTDPLCHQPFSRAQETSLAACSSY